MKIHHIQAMILAMSVTLAAAADDNKTTTTAYNFLDVSPSSHVYGLGGHNVSLIDDDINLVEQNPALLGPEFDHQVGLNYMRYIGSTNFMGARYGQGINEHSAFAVGIQYYGYGDLDYADQSGVRNGTFSASDMAISATYSHDIAQNWRGGITLKYIYSKYEDYSAGAVAADLGINYYDPDHEFSVSLVGKNLGGQVKKFNEKRDDLPWDIQMGFTKALSQAPFRFSMTVYNMRWWHLPYYEPEDKNNSNSALVKKDKFASNLFRHLVFSGEFTPSENIYIGLGYNHKVRTDMSTYHRTFLSGITIGGGLKVKAFGFGVAFAQPHSGATTFMLNITSSLGELLGR